MVVPSSIRRHLEQLTENTPENERFISNDHVKQVASWIVTFDHVIDVEPCVELPLVVAPGWMFCAGVLSCEGVQPIDN